MTDILKWLFGNRGRQTKPQTAQSSHVESASVPGFPVELLSYHQAIEATRMPILAGTELKGLPDRADGSQLGGRPWWPKDRPYPTDTDGNPLVLLIQVDFDAAPVLKGFPEQGLLQVFIGSDDLYGADIDGLRVPRGFACHYHETTDGERLDDFSRIVWAEDISTPLNDTSTAVPLTFALSTMVMDLSDYRFARRFPEILNNADLSNAYDEIQRDLPPIRLGGYPSFTQPDPRSRVPGIGDISLLTIESTANILWGDSGIAQFFVEEDDLARRNFSRVVYNWDCY